jgi:hypothetical protein
VWVSFQKFVYRQFDITVSRDLRVLNQNVLYCHYLCGILPQVEQPTSEINASFSETYKIVGSGIRINITIVDISYNMSLLTNKGLFLEDNVQFLSLDTFYVIS